MEYHTSQQDYEERLHFRHLMRSRRLGGTFHAHQFVFCDESHVDEESIRRKYGYSPKGSPAFMLTGCLHGRESISCVASMGVEGILTCTPCESVDQHAFLRILEHDILPHLNPFPMPKSVLIIDNAAVHVKQLVSDLCQQFGVLVLFLPKYSYDFNPIEVAFHVAKAYIRNKYPGEDHDRPLPGRLIEALMTSVSAEMACKLYQHCYIEITEDDINYINRL